LIDLEEKHQFHLGLLRKERDDHQTDRRRLEKRLHDKEVELKSLQSITENLNDALASARGELDELRNEHSALKHQVSRATNDYQIKRISTSTNDPAFNSFLDRAPSSISIGSAAGPVPLSDLLMNSASTVSPQPMPVTTRERELQDKIQEISDLLAESECNIARLLEQEKVIHTCGSYFLLYLLLLLERIFFSVCRLTDGANCIIAE
jgi:uncharacterized coiled-coil protein SlyX